jgi:hypothetical protein
VITVLIAPTLLRRVMSGLASIQNGDAEVEESCALPLERG